MWRQKNQAVLETVFPGITRGLASFEPTPDAELAETSSGHPTLKLAGAFVHSRYDPRKEAEKLIASELKEKPSFCIFFGFGLGYQVEEFALRHPSIPFCVLEPDARLFLKALESRDLEGLFRSPGFSLVVGEKPDAVAEVLRLVRVSRIQVIRLRSVYAKDEAWYREAEAHVTRHLQRKEVNLATLNRFGRLWVRNLAANLGLVFARPGVAELFGRFSGLPALVLCAGPSLDELRPLLPELRRRFVLVCVDTAARACAGVGIEPDFLVVVDPQYWNTRHLDNIRFESTILVSESSTHPRAFRGVVGSRGPEGYGGRVFLCSSLFPLGRELEDRIGSMGKVGAGGSVATSAWDFIRLAGCGPVVMAGMDLSFPGLRTHFKGARFEERSLVLSDRLSPMESAAFHALRDASPFLAPSNDGGTVLTDTRLAFYKSWFEAHRDQAEETPTYTVSEKGLRIEGIEYRDDAFLMSLPVRREEIDGIKATLSGSPRRLDPDKVSAAVGPILVELREIRRLGESALGIQRDLMRDLEAQKRNSGSKEGAAVRRRLKDLEEIDARLLSKGGRNIAGFLLQNLVREIEDSADGEKAEEETLRHSRLLYEGLAESAEYNLRYLEKGLQRIVSME